MRVLSLTTLYPSEARPSHGIFVENRLRAVAKRGHEIKVIAPVPRFPFRSKRLGEYSRFAATPRSETRHGIEINHPKYLVVPKIGMTATMHALTQCFKDAIATTLANGFYPDLIDAHYFYPDGVAACAAATHFGLPFIVTARGTDINFIPQFARQKTAILEAADKAAASITVAEALRTEMITLGCDGNKIVTLRNGVDLTAFAPLADRQNNQQLTIVSIGHLIERKGHHLVIETLTEFPDAKLIIAGRGIEEKALKQQAQTLGVIDRVTFVGERPHKELKEVYGRADITVLASSREGWPNVLLESMACGTPCVATPVWGSGEVITRPEAGKLAAERSSTAIAAAIRDVTAEPAERDATRRYAQQFGWAPIAKAVEKVWKDAANTGWGRITPLSFSEGTVPAIFTVDTEEAFDWHGRHDKWALPSPDALDTLQKAAEEMGVQPLYFTTHPLLEDDEIGDRLAQWVANGKAACGIHLHTWSTPPGGEPAGPVGTFQCNIDPELHRQKLNSLIDSFVRRIGHRPIAHRAGRYGAAPWVLDQLAEEGVMLDFSPSAGFDSRSGAGPDFSRFGNLPRVRETAFGSQWVFPVSGARKWRGTRQFSAPHGWFGRSILNPLRMNVTVPVRLSPEGHRCDHLTDLTRHLLAQAGNLLTPSIHLTSIMPGATPYAHGPKEAANLLTILREWYLWTHDKGVKPITLDQLTAHTLELNQPSNSAELSNY